MEYLCLSFPLIVGLPLLWRVLRSERGSWPTEARLIAALALAFGAGPSLTAISLWPVLTEFAPTLTAPFTPMIVVGPHVAAGATCLFLALLVSAALRLNLAALPRPDLDPTPPAP